MADNSYTSIFNSSSGLSFLTPDNSKVKIRNRGLRPENSSVKKTVKNTSAAGAEKALKQVENATDAVKVRKA